MTAKQNSTGSPDEVVVAAWLSNVVVPEIVVADMSSVVHVSALDVVVEAVVVDVSDVVDIEEVFVPVVKVADLVHVLAAVLDVVAAVSELDLVEDD